MQHRFNFVLGTCKFDVEVELTPFHILIIRLAGHCNAPVSDIQSASKAPCQFAFHNFFFHRQSASIYILISSGIFLFLPLNSNFNFKPVKPDKNFLSNKIIIKYFVGHLNLSFQVNIIWLSSLRWTFLMVIKHSRLGQFWET